MSIKKKCLESKPKCSVTFKLSKDLANSYKEIYLVGDFNRWDEKADSMKKLKNGEFSITISLDKGNDYQFKYLANKSIWFNDEEADKFVANEFEGQNSVVSV